MGPKAKGAVQASPRKRQKTNTPAAAPPAMPAEKSTVPQMSAVAARKAAAAATKEESSDSDSEDESEEEEEALGSDEELKAAAYSSTSSAEDDQPRKTPRLKKKPLSAGRYFAGEESTTKTSRPRSVAGVSTPMGEMERFVNDEEEPVLEAEAVEVEEQKTPSQGKLGRGKRQRREKSAFLDPFCTSSFSPNSSSNAVWITWTTSESESRRGLVLALDSGETVIIHGSYKITPIFGSVAVLGATLHSTAPSVDDSSFAFDPQASSSHTIFAPSSHPLPIITANQLPFLAPSSTPYPTTIRLPSGDDLDVSASSSVVLIEDLSSGIEGVEIVLRCGGLGGGNGMWEVVGSSSKLSDEWSGAGWRLILEPTPSLTSVRSPDSWRTTLSDFAPHDRFANDTGDDATEGTSADVERLVCMVEGPKRAGKSTFSKLLLNRLLSKFEHVAYLDTDLGQPEFTPPGLVSLSVLDRPVLGPSFTHLSLPVASHFLGSTSPASDPSAYLAAINALLTTYSEIEYPLLDDQPATSAKNGKIRDRIPLVVNTQGWIKGLGADLLEKIKAASRPTHLFRFEAPVEEGREGWNEEPHPADGDSESTVYRLDVAESSPLDSKWSPADLRTLGFISYFHSRFSTSTDRMSSTPTNTFPDRWDFSQALVERTPWELDWTDREMLCEVHFLSGEIDSKQVLYALNGVIVAVVTSSQPPHATTRSFPYSIDSPFPDPATSNCHSLAFIRSISPASTLLHLLLPASPSTITPADGADEGATGIRLVKGELELPICLMLDYNIPATGATEAVAMPYLSIEEGVGRKKVRRNLMRRGQN